ncbi:glycosyltransferase family 1 protein [Deltaproteobacteria bacterium TL4]
MKIAISLFQFYPGYVGGAGEYIEQLVHRLPPLLKDSDQLFLFGNSQNLAPFESLNDARIIFINFPLSPRLVRLLRFLDLFIPNCFSAPLAWILNTLKFDVVLFPQQSIFPQGLRCKKKVTVVVDFLHYHYPENFSRLDRWIRLRKEAYMVNKSDQILCISEFSRQDLIQKLGFAANRSTAICLGTSTDEDMEQSSATTQDVPFVLYPANPYPHKNHTALIEAFEQFKQKHSQLNCQLILTGRMDQRLSHRIRLSPAKANIQHLGYVSKEQLNKLYQQTEALFFPSLFEGFGIPLVEALKYQKPIYCSDLPVFHELLGNTVNYFNPRSLPEMVRCLEQIFIASNPIACDVSAYQAILDKLNWKRFVEETLELLKR